MDEELMLAAQRGNVQFLRKAIISKHSANYFISYTHEGYGIFHLAVKSTKCTPFIQEAIEKLPKHIVQILLSKQDNTSKWNPLHWATFGGNLDAIRLILGVYTSPYDGDVQVEGVSDMSKGPSNIQDTPSGGKPWLAADVNGETPLHIAFRLKDQRCAMEILSIDMMLLLNMLDKHGSSPLFLAVRNGYNEVALKILNSNYPYSLGGHDGYNPFHFVPKCSEEVLKLLHEKHPNLLHETNNEGATILHSWAVIGKSWPVTALEKADPNSLKKLSGVLDREGNTPLHLAVLYYKKGFARCLGEKCPIAWRFKNKYGMMPLELALRQGWEDIVLGSMFMDSWTNEELEGHWQRWILIAVHKGMDKFVQKLLRYLMFLDHSLPTVDHDGDNNREQVWALLQNHPELFAKLLDKIGVGGNSLVHEWAKKCEPGLLQLLKQGTVDTRNKLFQLTNSIGDTLVHISMEHGNQAFAMSIVQIIVEYEFLIIPPPWQQVNAYGITPFDIALQRRFEEIVLLIISRDSWTYTTRNALGTSRLFIAVEQGMDPVVEKICQRIALESSPPNIPTDHQDGRTIIHVLSNCQESTGRKVLGTIPMPKPSEGREGVIDVAAQFGEEWLTKLLIAEEPLLVKSSPNAWIHLCKRGHLDSFLNFIDKFPDFRMHCTNKEDTPLHHIKLNNDKEYEKFIKIPLIREMKNQRDSNGKTPLHRALEEKDIRLVEQLLKIGADRSIRDRKWITPTKLLAELCEQHHEWELMAHRMGINPRLKNLGSSVADMRNTLSVVAALLATITFAAAFTIPGGFNQSSGQVVLVTDASFLAFILADTYAMCCAMFVLFCLIWSMVCDEDESKLLIDRSVLALVHSFYGTLVAFMTGVFTVIHQKSLWAAILIIIMCSLVAILTRRSILFRILDVFDRSDEAWSKNRRKLQMKTLIYP